MSFWNQYHFLIGSFPDRLISTLCITCQGTPVTTIRPSGLYAGHLVHQFRPIPKNMKTVRKLKLERLRQIRRISETLKFTWIILERPVHREIIIDLSTQHLTPGAPQNPTKSKEPKYSTQSIRPHSCHCHLHTPLVETNPGGSPLLHRVVRAPLCKN